MEYLCTYLWVFIGIVGFRDTKAPAESFKDISAYLHKNDMFTLFESANALQTAHGLISFKFTFFNSQNTNRLQFILFMLYGSL